MAEPHRGHRGSLPEDVVGPTAQSSSPPLFGAALTAIAEVSLRPEIELEPLPAPRRLASFGHAVAAAVLDPGGEELGDGRFVVLFEPAGHEEWLGVFRFVTLIQAELEPEIADDPLLSEVAWSWLTESLAQHGAEWVALGGTVSRCASQSFGELVQRPPVTTVELRASWTPATPSGGWTPDRVRDCFGDHFSAWGDLLSTAAGLPPLVAGVSVLPGRS
jgi:Protein of unknown function (DUF3000)